MDWNGNLRPFVSQPEFSFGFVYNYEQYPGIDNEMKHDPVVVMEAQPYYGVNNNINNLENANAILLDAGEQMKNNNGNDQKKKRLATNQLESLESSFQEEIRLTPDRKMKLARELGLQPRQVAIWFQNRRARWKAKQLQRLYDSLKKDFDLVSREKLKLQEEVSSLKLMLREQVAAKLVSGSYTEISGEETVESTTRSNRPRGTRHQQIAESGYNFSIDDYSKLMPPYWGTLPKYPCNG